MKQETKSEIALAIAYGLMLLVIIGIVSAALVAALRELVKLAAPIIAAASGIMIAILNHATATLRAKEEELRQIKQQNYLSIIERLAPYVRTRRSDDDKFETAHMQTWIAGSPKVVKLTKDLIEHGGNDRIRALLLEMRRDIGMEVGDLEDMETKFLKAPKTQPPGEPGMRNLGIWGQA